MKIANSRIVMGLFLEAIALCLITSFRFINIESTATLMIFNLLFVSLTFQLNGTINRKLGMMALGNVIGLLWSFVLYFLGIAGAIFFGEIFRVFYAVIYPVLNFMWIVSFWSLSLSVLPNPNNNAGKTHDY
jgi:hypothetical protein